MRIYEIAKEAGVSSAEVLKAAEAAGISASSAISTVDDGDVGKLRGALKGADGSSVRAKRQAKVSKAAALNAQFFAEQKAKLAEHLRIAKEAAEKGKKVEIKGEGGQRNASPASSLPPPTPASSTSAQPVKPVIRMAPGHKPKPLPTISAAQTGLTAAGFKPLQHARPAATIFLN